MRYIGQPVPRREDEALVRGRGRFTDDLQVPGSLHMAVLRSPHAHARIRGVNPAPALRREGVVAAVSAQDLGAALKPIPLYMFHPALNPRLPCPLARGVVRYVGEPVAAVVATSRYLAEAALEAIEAEYEALPVVTDARKALDAVSPLVHTDLGSNLAARVRSTVGDVDAAFAMAHTVVEARLRIGRQTSAPLEPRSAVARWDRTEGLTVYDSTQSVHMVRRVLSHLLDLPEQRIRVVAPDVGGGFGGKNRFYPEELLTAWFSRELERPVRWTADRLEDLLVMYQEREQEHEAEAAFSADGTLLGVRGRFWADNGAYTPFGIVVPLMTMNTIPGPYRLRNYSYEMNCVYTNKPGVAPFRGAGRPQGSFVIERLLDLGARALGMDRAEIRLRNLVTAEEQPYDTGLLREGRPIRYDGGDYPRALREALRLINYPFWQAERKKGRPVGVGMGVGIEMAAVGPPEGARIEVDQHGNVTIWSGAASQGQGLETVLAQVCADRLGVPLERITVRLGDTAGIAQGGGTWGSRTAVTAGNAVAAASAKVREKAIALAGALLEAGPGDLELAEGQVFVRGAPARSLTLASLARAAAYPNFSGEIRWPNNKPYPWGDESGLSATEYHRPDFTYGYSAHTCVVEADPETGLVRVLSYAVAHDCGTVLNPDLVDGQVRGAVAQGLGGALLEESVFDENGQPVAVSFMDYLLPTAGDVPRIMLAHLHVGAGRNPEGIKGAGEGGLVPTLGAVAGAIDEALGTRLARTPFKPDPLFEGRRAGGA